MADLKSKQKDLKNISGGTDLGGAPFYANDFVRLQQNAKADYINSMEALRRQLPELILDLGGGGGPQKYFENGIILSGLEYDNTDTNNPIIKEGYVLSGGEVCYFPETIINTGVNPNETYVFIKKGALSEEIRVFDDGANKPFLVEYGVSIDQVGRAAGGGPQLPDGLVGTDEYVVLTVGTPAEGGWQTVAEDYFSYRAAVGTSQIGGEIKRGAFINVQSLDTGYSVDGDGINSIGSKVNEFGATLISGSIRKTFTGSESDERAFILADLGVNISIGGGTVLPFPITVKEVGGGFYNAIATVDSTRNVRVFPYRGSTFTADEVIFYFNAELVAAPGSYTDSYEFNNNYLDITP